MPPSLAELVNRFGVDLHELNGSSVSGEVPLSAALVNRLVAQKLARTPGPVAAARIEPHPDQRVDVTLSLRNRLVPTVRIAARIEQQPQLPHPAILGVRWSLPGMGPLGLFAGPALSFFKLAPLGIHVDAHRVSIDIGELLRAQGLGEIVDYLTFLEITTREGLFVVRVAARIGGPAQAHS